ncbi:MAG: Zn-ribbon domain-containing OB-fold protein [Dehalococcoidales bacterium]|nr:Zn-ribbon domain-containing OB-fold protein [Dehalococcoidales bacterium]
MQTYEKPLPLITDEAKTFWENAKKHQFVIQKCKDCGHYQFYPRWVCAECWSENLEWVKSEGRGVIYSYTTVHRPPMKAFQPDVPYTLALIDLKEGPRMLSAVIGCKPEDVKIGMPVKVTFDDITAEVSLPKFKKA